MLSFKKPKQVVSILGMHRSGTSALTGSLQQCGLALGMHHTWNRHNQKGNRENQEIVDLHDAVLAHNGGSWDNPPKKVAWQPEHINTARRILEQYADLPLWGFKDPRTLLVLEQWKQLCPNLILVGVFRHPMAVAQSLHARNSMPIAQGLALWQRYNSALLAAYKSKPFPLISFEKDGNQFHQNVSDVASTLGLKEYTTEDLFYSEDLHHHNYDTITSLPWRVSRLYKKLCRLAITSPHNYRSTAS